MFCLPSLESNVSACFLHYFSLYSCNTSLGLISQCLVLCLFHIFLTFFSFLPFLELLLFGFYCFLYLITPPLGLPLSTFAFCYTTDCSLQLHSLLFQPCPTVPQISHCPQYLYPFLVTFLNMPSIPLVSSVSIP